MVSFAYTFRAYSSRKCRKYWHSLLRRCHWRANYTLNLEYAIILPVKHVNAALNAAARFVV